MWSGPRKRLQRQVAIYEERLQCLTEDYEALSRQISSETNAKVKNDFRRQLALVEEELEQAELEQQRLWAKLRSLEAEPIYTPEPEPEPLLPTPNPRIHIQSSYFIGLPRQLSKYLLPCGTTIFLVSLWLYLGHIGVSVADEPGILPEGIRQKLAVYGCIGGLATGLSLHLTTYLRQRSTRLNAIRLLIHGTVASLLGGISWYLLELSIHNTLDEARYGEGATLGANICIFISLFVLWLPLAFSPSSNR